MFGWPKLVSDNRGVTTVDWTEGGVVKFAQRDRAGTWSAPVSIGCVRPRHDYCYTADLAVDGAGTVTAVWEFERGRRSGVEVAQRPVGGTWTRLGCSHVHARHRSAPPGRWPPSRPRS